MTIIICKTLFWKILFFLSALIVKKQSYFGWNLLYSLKKTSWTKLGSLSIPNLNLSKKIEKERQISVLFYNLVALILG